MFNLIPGLENQFIKTVKHSLDNSEFYPKAPIFDIFNYFNLLNQLQVVLFYKQINVEFAKQFGMDSYKNGNSNDIFVNPYTDFAIQYYQDKLSSSFNNIINAYCPFRTFYNFKGL